MTPIQASLKKNEGYVYKNFLDKRKKIKPKNKIGDLVRTADLKKKYFQNRIQQIGLISYMKLQKLLMIQYQVIKSIVYQKEITNRY